MLPQDTLSVTQAARIPASISVRDLGGAGAAGEDGTLLPPAQALRMATPDDAALLALAGQRNPYPGNLGVVEEGALGRSALTISRVIL